MKKLLILLAASLAIVSLAFTFTSCEKENLNDPTVYCWRVTMEYSSDRYTLDYDFDLPMTNKEKKELEEKGYYYVNGTTVDVTKIVKIDQSECGL